MKVRIYPDGSMKAFKDGKEVEVLQTNIVSMFLHFAEKKGFPAEKIESFKFDIIGSMSNEDFSKSIWEADKPLF